MMQAAYTSESDLLCDLKRLWSGNRTVSNWTDYDTLGKVFKQMKAIWPGTSGLVAIAGPDGQSLISVLYAPPNEMHSGEPEVMDNSEWLI